MLHNLSVKGVNGWAQKKLSTLLDTVLLPCATVAKQVHTRSVTVQGFSVAPTAMERSVCQTS